MKEIKERFDLTELLVTTEGEILVCFKDLPGFHFPVDIEPDVLERVREMKGENATT